MTRKAVKKLLVLWGIILLTLGQTTIAQDAPVTTAGTVTSTTTTAIVPLSVVNFVYIGSCMLEIHYDSTIATATNVTMGSGMTGGLNSNLDNAGVIILGWYTYPAITLPDNSVIFNITFSKVAPGTTALTFYDDGYSCYYSNGDYTILNDNPASTFYLPGSLTFGASLTADFTVNNTTPPLNTPVTFTDLTTGSPSAWTWSFNRTSVVYVNGTSASSQHPQVQFTEGGLYTVTLLAADGNGSDTEIKTDYIRAGVPGWWTGSTSSDWATPANWENQLIPTGTIDVVIPSSAVHWPVFTGDITPGVTCKSLTIQPSAVMTIEGNVTIEN
ncbi:MAG TPA: PKD domain-containing protein [Bacteroidales bacterium]|nr:PKD domain-containing protein [Bacteroidales bacterium]